MKNLEKLQKINIDNLDREQYFQSFFGEVCSKQLLEENRIQKIQFELVDLLAKEVERYTSGESSSVLVEKAKQLFQSICYNIGIYLKTIEDMDTQLEQLKSEKISVLFYHGMDVITSYYNHTKSVLANLQSQLLKISNIAYQDTICKGVPEFFHDYEYEYAAHEVAGSIDYPLCNTVENNLGIEYMKEYIDKLKLENDFCRHFSDHQIELLLQGFHKDYDEILINIYELVLTNALGCMLLGQNMIQLNINKDEIELLQKSLNRSSKEELLFKLRKAFEDICKEFKLESDQVEYGKIAVLQIARRLEHNLFTDTLDQLFITFPDKNLEDNIIYKDGLPMEDEKLRELIDEMKDCEILNDKLSMIQKEVHSLADLTEIMEECFYGDELFELFQLFGEDEIQILMKSIREEMELSSMKNNNPLKEWQLKLIQYSHNVINKHIMI